MRLQDFMTSCRDKLYHHTISSKIKFNFLIILFGKMSSSKSLPLSGTESEIERMTDFFRLVTLLSWTDKIKSSICYDRNSVKDLTSSNDIAENGMNGRIGNTTWCKFECCAPMKTSIECVCCPEIPEIRKPRFSSILCLHVCRSDPHFVLWYSMRENFVSYLISTKFWTLANLFLHKRCFFFVSLFFQKSIRLDSGGPSSLKSNILSSELPEAAIHRCSRQEKPLKGFFWIFQKKLLWSFIFSISHLSISKAECIAKSLFTYLFCIYKLCLKARDALQLLSDKATNKTSVK